MDLTESDKKTLKLYVAKPSIYFARVRNTVIRELFAEKGLQPTKPNFFPSYQIKWSNF